MNTVDARLVPDHGDLSIGLSVFADLLGNTDSVDESRLPRLRHVRLVPLLRKEIELIPHVPPALPRFPSSSPPPPQRSRPPVSLAPPAPPPPDSVKTLILAVGSNQSPPALYSKTPPGAFGAARSSAATTANTRSSTPAGRAGWATKLGVTHSEIARAVADSPAAPTATSRLSCPRAAKNSATAPARTTRPSCASEKSSASTRWATTALASCSRRSTGFTATIRVSASPSPIHRQGLGRASPVPSSTSARTPARPTRS